MIALISGITGQDGYYLTKFLLEKGYIVWGMIRKTSAPTKTQYIDSFKGPNLFLRHGDLAEGNTIVNILREIHEKYPDMERLEVYNLGALTHVGLSFEMPEYTANINGLGVLRFLEAIRNSGFMHKIKFYQASTSELFGKVVETPQTETTPLYPRSPYGIAKQYAFWLTRNYREAYNMFACNGILYNHESPYRNEVFATRKITLGLSDIIHNRADKLVLGNIYASRDMGHARDYVKGMWLMMQQEVPDDYILCTNETHTIKEFVEKAFKLKGFDIKWKGEGLEEIGYDCITGRELIFISEEFFRPTEVDILLGDNTKASTILGWQYECTFEKLIEEMVEHDCKK